MRIKIQKRNLIYYYVVFLFFMPNDLFEWTSIYIFDSPVVIKSYYTAIAYLSFLYFPVVFYGTMIYLENKRLLKMNIVPFLACLLFKDVLGLLFHSFIFQYSAYEMYVQYIIAVSMCYVIVNSNNTYEKMSDFINVFGIITCATNVVSIVTGIGVGRWGDYTTRYHASSMSQGETAYFLAMFAIWIFCVKKYKYRWLYLMGILMLVFSTGCRKDVLYIIAVIFLFFALHIIWDASHIKKIKNPIKDGKKIFAFLGTIFLGVTLLNNDSVKSKLNIDRIFQVIQSLYTNNLAEFSMNDASGTGRIRSMASGIEVIKDNSILGTNFCYYDMQYQLQNHGFPTFPHSTIIFYACVMGGLVVIPIYLYVKIFIKLFLMRNDYFFVVLHFMIHNIISGGALLDIKTIIQNILVLYIGLVITDGFRKGGYSSDEKNTDFNSQLSDLSINNRIDGESVEERFV